MKTLQDFDFSGFSALESILEKTYGGVAQALASLTLFAHPETVAQTGNRALFPIIRATAVSQRGTVLVDKKLVLCDNTSCQDAFLWTHSLKYRQFKDVQFNHVYSINEPDYYTSLANICVTPVFLAKLTDTHEEFKAILRYRVYACYGFVPTGFALPEKPTVYDQLEWAPFMPVVNNLADVIRKRLIKKKKARAAIAVQNFGWIFSDDAV
ncbi:hypothetical protein [Spirosoma sordidisoli]|uniref:Uncharacterized protein n=1 Tax=Spirosoma sordidisoli TaxID=2502893 RepID=A0A4Q2UKL6_9BACT|nr:hypothetical protein [Spirosoma sordidisoli]RYC70063.1 hypothetical protein EQG79_09335 [Spirosoma sordidisoli]